MSAAPDPGLLYTALMLRKLHELRAFRRVLDAGAGGRYRALLADHLPGAAWIGAADAWTPVLGELRLRRRGESLGLTDIRIAAAARLAGESGADLALFEDVLEPLEPADALALAAAWLKSSSLVVVPAAALPVAAALPGLVARFAAGGGDVCFLSADAGRARQVAQLQELIPAIVRRMTAAA